MLLLKWCIPFSCIKGNPKCYFPRVQWLGHLVLLTPSWPGFPIPHPLPTPCSAQLVSGCGAEERGLHNPQQERDRLSSRAPRDPVQPLWKESHGVSHPAPDKSQAMLEELQDQLADVCRCGKHRQHCLQHQGEPGVLRATSASTVFLWPRARCKSPSAHS